MTLKEIIAEMERNILAMQQQVDALRAIDIDSADTMLLTRQQAADLLGKSLRQLDRDCQKFGIEKEECSGGIRIRRTHLLKHMGVLPNSAEESYTNEFDRITKRLVR